MNNTMRTVGGVGLFFAMFGACSVINSPDDPKAGGAGGDGGAGGAGPSGSTANSGGGTTSNVSSGTGGACQGGTVDCDGDCVDTMTDPLHCGDCDTDCPPGADPNTVPICDAGSCGVACAPGFEECDPAQPGCETNVDADPLHCGDCVTVCPPAPNAMPACMGGICGVGACTAPFEDCNADPADGCEADLTSDEANCGGCNVPCNAGDTCSGGGCTNIDLTGVFASYSSAGRDVHIWKTPPCANLANFVGFCAARGLQWFKPKSQPDAQQLIDFAYGLDSSLTWIQVYGLQTGLGSIGGYPINVDSPSCCYGHDGSAWAGFRKWGCSFCEPATGLCPSIGTQNTGNQSCCWDKQNPYDWFVCEA